MHWSMGMFDERINAEVGGPTQWRLDGKNVDKCRDKYLTPRNVFFWRCEALSLNDFDYTCIMGITSSVYYNTEHG